MSSQMQRRIAGFVEKDADNRLAMLEKQKEQAEKMLAAMQAFERENGDAEWDGAIAALEDSISNLTGQIEKIDDWKGEQIESGMADYADRRRDMMLSEGF